jgi:hypothetical protein
MPIGTRLVSNNNVIGTVVGPNNIQLNVTGHNRLQQVRMINPNMVQGNPNMRMPLNQMQQNPRQNLIQGIPQQQNIQGMQPQVVNQQPIIGQQQQQQQPGQNIPPPPYPEPPPPYPGQTNSGQSQVMLI